MEVHFAAIIERASDGFSVYFPDLPGCTSAGDTVQAAAANAGDALAFHLAGMTEDGDTVPEPTPLDAIERDIESSEIGRILVATERPGKSIRLSITMDEALIGAIDRVAANRSGFLAEAARAALARRS
ncbi:type II toxin-antitoxin system HicB family antitoxin [Sandarakinorhabdus glacialis]|nr:type II toxin-antitoxin system HicB family antitoxin [Polymorphobacter glacialis]